jgi:beta-lactamase regulating signal transducer with metallopeptidase domain
MRFHLLLPLGGGSPLVNLTISLALTYTVHAFVSCLAAACLGRYVSWSASLLNGLWKFALFAPLVTASVATLRPERPNASENGALLNDVVLFPTTRLVQAQEAQAEILPAGIFAALGILLLLGLVRFGLAALGLRRILQSRTALEDARLLQRLAGLQRRTRLGRVRLTQSDRIDSPLVLGTAEICVPRGSLDPLDPTEVDAIFAHELAHLERRDGFWFPAVVLLQSLLWLHPITSWAARCFRHTAELACDDRAVQLTREPVALAQALLRIAAAAISSRSRALVPKIAGSAQALHHRVQRLMSANLEGDDRRGRFPASWMLASLLAMSLGITTASVGIALPARALGASCRADTTAAGEQILALARREQRLERELAEANQSSVASNSENPARELELSQELRHVRAHQIWLETRFLNPPDDSCQ